MRTAAYNVDVASDRRRRKNVQGTFFVLEIIKMSTQIKKRLTIKKDMAILFSYVVNRINSTITQKMRWRYCYTYRIRRKGNIPCQTDQFIHY